MDLKNADDRYRQAATKAVRFWSFTDPVIEIVSVSENVTYRIQALEGVFVLRLHRPRYHTLQELQSERQWTNALLSSGTAVPRGVETKDGRYYVEVSIGKNERRYVGVTNWIEGVPIRHLSNKMTAKQIEDQFEKLGEIAARLHNHSSVWKMAQDFSRHSFDTEGYFGEKPFWGKYWQSPSLKIVEKRLILDKTKILREVLLAYGKNDATYSLIHGDLHFGNVLVCDNETAIIDFDDAGYGWHQYELAVALSDDEISHEADSQSNQEALIRGYRRHRAFSEVAKGLIDSFILIRAMVSLGWIEQRPEHRSELRVRQQIDHICNLCEMYKEPSL